MALRILVVDDLEPLRRAIPSILSIREMRQFGEEVKIHSDGSGTKVLVTIPLANSAGDADSPEAESSPAAILSRHAESADANPDR